MKIGICGAQSTGKTTIINILEGMGFPVYKLVARTVMKDHPINKDGDYGTQRAIIDTHLKNLADAESKNVDCFMDRCLVDGLVFTWYGVGTGKINPKYLAPLHTEVMDNLDRYDYIVYLEPEFDIVPDGVRDVDDEFRKGLCNLYETILKSTKVPIIRPKGTPNERVQMILCSTGLFKEDKNEG